MSLRPVAAAAETQARADFLAVARHVASTRGEMMRVRDIDEQRYTPRVQALIKSGVFAGSTLDSNWAGVLSDWQGAVSAFFQSLRGTSVFDRLLSDGGMKRVPLKSRGAVVSGTIPGAGVGEGTVHVIGALSFNEVTALPRNSAAVVVVTSELLRFGASGIAELFNAELRGAVAAATDETFLAELYAATTPTASSGSTLDAVLTDLGALLSAVATGATSQVYFIIDPTNAKKLALKSGSAGPAFPNFGLNGGPLMPGVMGLVSDNLPAGAAIMVDATGLMGGSDMVALDVLRHGSLQMESAPDSPATASTVLRSLWHNNELALRAQRYWAFGLSRADAVASLSGVSY